MNERQIIRRLRIASPASRTLFASVWLFLCLMLCSLPLHAQGRAFLDRDRIARDETVMLTIQFEILTQTPPNFGEFLDEFEIVEHAMQPQPVMSGGRVSFNMTINLRLRPKREGLIEIPQFVVGNEVLGPLQLMVTPPLNVPSSSQPPPPPNVADNGAPAMLQTSIDASSAYVQQSVGYVVRLYYDPTRLIDGEIKQPPPAGATLLSAGKDIEYDRVIGTRQYRVIERRFMVLANRPGLLQLPPPTFEGRGVMSMFNEMFGGGGDRGTIRIAGDARSLQVRPIPAHAPQPWLPLHGLKLRYLSATHAPRVGEAAKVTVELAADGANAVLLPELQLTTTGDAQIFPEPVQTQEGFVNDRPRAIVKREFSVVPQKDGALRIVAPKVVWWDVQAGVARTAALPDLRWDVAPATAVAGPAPAANGAVDTSGSDDGATSETLLQRFIRNPVGVLTVVTLVMLWIIALYWGGRLWLERRRLRAGNIAASAARGYDAFAYKRLFDNGSLAEIADALCAMAQPVAKDVGRLRAMLDDPAQRAAIDTLQRARWGDGNIVEARAQLRDAFADGPRWRRARTARAPGLLPPLYPER